MRNLSSQLIISLLESLSLRGLVDCHKHLAPDGARQVKLSWLSPHDSHLIHQHTSSAFVRFNPRVPELGELWR